MADITKIGLAVVDQGRVLLVRKRGSQVYILPGGKPEAGEDDLAALRRELDEELGCDINPASLDYLGSFTDEAAGMPGVRVTIRLYSGVLTGTPEPRSEIDRFVWFSPFSRGSDRVAPSLDNYILPFLFRSTPAAVSIG